MQEDFLPVGAVAAPWILFAKALDLRKFNKPTGHDAYLNTAQEERTRAAARELD